MLRSRFGLSITLAALIGVALSGGCSRPDRPHVRSEREAPPAMRFLALGDSYTIGESVGETGRWPAQLVIALHERGVAIEDAEIVARTGWTTDELAAGIRAAAPRGPFALVTLQIGVNNQYRGRPLEEYRAQLEDLLREAVGFAGDDPSHVIVLSIPDWGVTPYAAGRDRKKIAAEIDRFNAAALAETQRAGARWVDVTPASRLAARDSTLVAADGLHPSPRMYAAWVQAVMPVALEALGEPKE